MLGVVCAGGDIYGGIAYMEGGWHMNVTIGALGP